MKGYLRRDLYYRLRVVPIRVPPAARAPVRRSDAGRTTSWRTTGPATATAASAAPYFSNAAIQALQPHPWPGNVRELQNVIEHAVVLLEPGSEIRPMDLPFLDSPTNVGGRTRHRSHAVLR